MAHAHVSVAATLTLDQGELKLSEFRDDSAHVIARFKPNASIPRYSQDYTARGTNEDDVTGQQRHE